LDEKYEEEKEAQTEDEQPSMITNSELRSIDLNILGECYIPSSDIFSDQKDNDNTDTEDMEVRPQEKATLRNYNTRNSEIVMKRDRHGNRIESMESEKIDSLLRKSIDNFIYETKDLYQDLEKTGSKKISKRPVSGNAIHENNQLPRSASQKYDYKTKQVNEADPRYMNISPLGSGRKKTSHKPQLHPTPPQTTQHFNVAPRYTSLIPQGNTIDPEIYYAQQRDNGRQIHHYSFNVPRYSDNVNASYTQQISSSLNYPEMHHNSLDDAIIHSNMVRYNMQDQNLVQYYPQGSPEFQFVGEAEGMRPNSQRHLTTIQRSPMIGGVRNAVSSDKLHIQNKSQYHKFENRSFENSPNTNKVIANSGVKNKRKSNQTIEEEQDSKSSREDEEDLHTNQKHIRNNTQINPSEDEIIATEETGYMTSQPIKYRHITGDKEEQKNSEAITAGQDSIFKQFESNSKPNSASKNQMTYLCFTLYEILNRNKIPVKSNHDDSSQDMIIKIFETVAHDLRLKKERVENLETEDSEKSKQIDDLKDKNDRLNKMVKKLQKSMDEQAKEYAEVVQAHEQNFEDFRGTEMVERKKYQQEIDRLKLKNSSLEAKYTQLEDQISEYRNEGHIYRQQVMDLRERLRQREKFDRNKDRANASFEVESSADLMGTKEAKKSKKKKDHAHIFTTEDSEDLSRAFPSADKKQHDIKITKGEMFDSSRYKSIDADGMVEASVFFKEVNDIFAPYKKCDQNELLNIIRNQYGKLLQVDDLIQLKTQTEVILGLPKNCDKSIIINKIKDLRTNSMMAQKGSEIGVRVEEYDKLNKNFEAYEEMKRMFESIKSSLKLQNNATFTETLRAVKKVLTKKPAKDKVEKKKVKNRINPSKVALNKTKIDLAH
jgi:cell division protein FtsB